MPSFGLGHLEFLLVAACWTIALSAVAFVGGGLLGFLVALARISDNPLLRRAAAGYVQVVQGTPLLILLFLIYFGLPILGFENVPALLAAGLGLTVYSSGFLGEIWRGCLQAIPKTQWEAGASLGLSLGEQLRYVIVPQSVRVAIPPTVGFLVQLIKNTSLAAVIGFVELTREGQLTAAGTYKPFAVYITVAAIYFAMCFPLSQWSRSIERKLDVAR